MMTCGVPGRQYSEKFAQRALKLLPKLRQASLMKRETDNSDARDLFFAYPMSTWGDAELTGVALYLRGARSLKIPDAWRPYLPSEIPALDESSDSD